MTKQEQIEEIAKVIDKTIRNECLLNNNGHCIDCNFIDKNTDEYDCQSLLISTLLYDAGYRKESDTAKEILGLLSVNKWTMEHALPCDRDYFIVKMTCEKYDIKIEEQHKEKKEIYETYKPVSIDEQGALGKRGLTKLEVIPSQKEQDELKTEIEELKSKIEELKLKYETLQIRNKFEKVISKDTNKIIKNMIKIEKEKAIKEFAKKLKKAVFDYFGVKTIEEARELSPMARTFTYDVVIDRINEILKKYKK